MSNIHYGWNTKKVGNVYKWSVTANTSRAEPNKAGSYVDSEVIHQGELRTRARATGHAKKVCLHYRRKVGDA